MPFLHWGELGSVIVVKVERPIPGVYGGHGFWFCLLASMPLGENWVCAEVRSDSVS